jgi:4a-hydroxytetrahydrobiopterin dehydratase
MSELATLECIPCRGGVPPLKGEQIATLLSQLQGWEVVQEHHLLKTFKTSNFTDAQNLVMKIGELADSQGHHPDICFGWGYCDVKIWTHKIDGLTESDFILAAKIDQIQA